MTLSVTDPTLLRHRYAVVVAGGSGTRLWPLSREALPKQMQSLMSDQPLIAETVGRLEGVVPTENILVSTTSNLCEQIRELLPQIPEENFVVEPEARGTPAAFALFAEAILRRDPDAVIFTLASDHAITEVEKLHGTIEASFEYVESEPRSISMVGIVPTRPDPELGYIRAQERLSKDPDVLRVEKYAEKPTRPIAQTYLDDGHYYWNVAYYCFRADTILEAYAAADEELVRWTAAYLDSGDPADYAKAPVKSHEVDIIDATTYPMALVPAAFRWSDIGSWAALHRELSELAGQDVVIRNAERHTDFGSHHILVNNTDDREVVTAGLDSIAVITTDDVVMVIDLRRIEEIPTTMREIIDRLRQQGKGELL